MTLDPARLEDLIAECLRTFYRHRLDKIKEMRLTSILGRKNPYLFRALATESASEIVQQIMRAFLSASDETIFGNDFFEPIAREASGGHASDAKGVDVIVETPNRISAYAVKSGTVAQNASASAKQQQEFDELRSRLFKLQKQFDPVLGAAYGRKNVDATNRRTFRTISGQKFWAELTGDSEFYVRLITLMRDIPEQHKRAYQPEWDAAVNRLTHEFFDQFCHQDTGHIDWEKLVRFVSSEEKPKAARRSKKNPD